MARNKKDLYENFRLENRDRLELQEPIPAHEGEPVWLEDQNQIFMTQADLTMKPVITADMLVHYNDTFLFHNDLPVINY